MNINGAWDFCPKAEKWAGGVCQRFDPYCFYQIYQFILSNESIFLAVKVIHIIALNINQCFVDIEIIFYGDSHFYAADIC